MIPATSVAEQDQAILVIIDVQERLAAVMARREGVLAATVLLLHAAMISEIPIMVTRQYPKGLGDIEAVLAETMEGGAVGRYTVMNADKVAFDCFKEPSFTESVCATGRRQLVIAGMETHICVAQTALSGLREGFDVHVVSDACCSRDDDAHASALQRLGNAGAVVTTSESVAYELIGEAGTPDFKRLLAVVKG